MPEEKSLLDDASCKEVVEKVLKIEKARQRELLKAFLVSKQYRDATEKGEDLEAMTRKDRKALEGKAAKVATYTLKVVEEGKREESQRGLAKEEKLQRLAKGEEPQQLSEEKEPQRQLEKLQLFAGGEELQQLAKDWVKKNKNNANQMADAYSSLAVVGSLVFGVAATSFLKASEDWHVSAINEEGGDVQEMRATLYSVFTALSSIFSAWGLIMATSRSFDLKRLSVMQETQVEKFLYRKYASKYMVVAQSFIWSAVELYLAALALFSVVVVGDDETHWGLFSIFTTGACMALVILMANLVVYLHRDATDKKEEKTGDATCGEASATDEVATDEDDGESAYHFDVESRPAHGEFFSPKISIVVLFISLVFLIVSAIVTIAKVWG